MFTAAPEEDSEEWRQTRLELRSWSRRFTQESLPSADTFVSPLVTPLEGESSDDEDEEETSLGPDGRRRIQGRLRRRHRVSPKEKLQHFNTELREGILRWFPDLHDWIVVRIGERSKALILLTYAVVIATQVVLFETTGWDREVDELDTTLIFASSSFCSLLLALTLSFLMEGPKAAIDQILNWHSFWRFLMIGVLFVLSALMQTFANQTKLHVVLDELLGYTYLPIAVFVSFQVFRRKYGILEWLSTAMLSFAIIAFFLVRERCHLNDCHKLFFWNPHADANPLGICLVIGSTTFSACASIYSERLYKNLSKGLMLSDKGYRGRHLWICKVHLDFAMLQVSGWMFVGQMMVKEGTGAWPSTWLTPVLSWTRTHALYVAVSVAQLWLTALVTKRYNTVVRAYAYSVVSILVICISDPISSNKYHFGERWLVSLSLLIIVVISMLIFQTGRLNLKILRQTLNLEKLPSGKFAFSDAWGVLVSRCVGANFMDILKSSGRYSAILLYILADGSRTVLQSVALGRSMGTPAVFVVVTNFAGLVLANVLIITQDGAAALQEAWNGRKVLRFMLCGLLFAVTSTLQTLAYALGISPALAIVLGRFYTPIMAILSYAIMKKYFMWLEWLAIVVLSLANLIYGVLQAQARSSSDSVMAEKSGLLPSAFVLGSAVTACINSLIMERLMKNDKTKFVIHKVRLDAGTVLWSVLFLPILGFLASGEEFAFWKARPWTKECAKLGSCSPGTFTFYSPDAEMPDCRCVRGLFVGWGHPAIYLALAANVFYSWITGVVVKQFDSFSRAIADGFSLAVVYFILEPLFIGGERRDWALSYVCILVPLSCLTYTFAQSEMKKVMDTIAKRKAEDHESKETGTGLSLVEEERSEESSGTDQSDNDESSGSS